MAHSDAVDRLVSALGDYPDALAPWVAAVRGLAVLLDGDDSDMSVWREYRFMLQALEEAAGGSDDDISRLLAEIDSRPGLRHSADS